MNARAPAIAFAVFVGVFAVGAGIWTYRSRHPEPTLVAAAARAPAGEASLPRASDFDSPFDPAVPLPTIPDRVPTFALADSAGKSTSIQKWHDKSLIINFWATWCAPCRREIPLLQSLDDRWRGRGIQVVGIAVDHPDQVRAFAAELKIAYPLLVGEQDALEVATSFGVESPAFPFTVFTDRRGEVVALYVGELHEAEADLILSVVENLDQNRVQLSEARSHIAAGLKALRPPSSG